MKAFWADIEGLGKAIVFDDTAPKARYIAYLRANDAGWGVELPAIRVWRAPSYDGATDWSGNIPPKRSAWQPEFLLCLGDALGESRNV